MTVRVRGERRLTLDSEESPKEALLGARNDARIRAVREVHGERAESWETLLAHDAGKTFSGVVLTGAVGVVRGVRELRSGWEPAAEGGDAMTVFYEAEIAVERTAEKPDPNFTAVIRGGKSRYVHGERAVFEVTAPRDAFLTVLWQNQEFQAAALCSARPLKAEKPERLSIIFRIGASRAKKEAGTLFFVLTKQERKVFAADGSLEMLDRWLASIPLRERFIYAVPFVIERP